MKAQRIEGSLPGRRLPAVLKEITERLLQDDWYRVCTDDGTRKYYVVGCADQAAELNGEDRFPRLELPTSTNSGPLSRWFVRSQLADNKPATFLQGARQNLERAGIPAAAIARYLAGEMDDFSDWKFGVDVSANERRNLLSNFFEAARLSFSDVQSVEMDGNEIEEANIAREKSVLKN